MIPDLVLFFGLAAIAIASALGMLLSRNAIYSAINLIINFITVAVFFLLLGAPFIALAQITVYAGAIMVLFLFVIMLLGAERLRTSQTLAWQQPLAIALSVLLVLETAYVLVLRPGSLSQLPSISPGFGAPQAIGQTLFEGYFLPFEVISVLLLVAMIGAIVLTRRERLEEEKKQES